MSTLTPGEILDPKKNAFCHLLTFFKVSLTLKQDLLFTVAKK